MAKEWAAAEPVKRRQMLNDLSAGGPTAKLPNALWMSSLETLRTQTQWEHWYRCASSAQYPVDDQVWDQFAETLCRKYLQPACANTGDTEVKRSARFAEKLLRRVSRQGQSLPPARWLEITQLICIAEQSRFNDLLLDEQNDLAELASPWSDFSKEQQLDLARHIYLNVPPKVRERWHNLATVYLSKLSPDELKQALSGK